MILHLKIGSFGEKEGVSYLKTLGYRILETNYKTPIGEIDCIAKDKHTIVFVEIKTRTSLDYGFPEEAVNGRKRQKIIQVAQLYLKEKRLFDKAIARFDVLSIRTTPEKTECSYVHLKNAFEIESKENT